MDFEPRQKPKEFKIKENGIISINDAKKKEYETFYQNFKEGGGSPKQFLSIFGDFIENCGFNLNNPKITMKDTVFIRGMTNMLPNSWTIYSDLDFQCKPEYIIASSQFAITGAVKEKTDKLLRLAQICNYPNLIELTFTERDFYQINIDDYCQLKTILILLAKTMSAANEIILTLKTDISNKTDISDEIILTLSDASAQLIRDMQKNEISKQFLNNLV